MSNSGKTAGASGTLWGGRFSQQPSEVMADLSRSTQFDWRIAEFDLDGSLAHARALARVNLITPGELQQLTAGLEELKRRVRAQTFVAVESDEDVHAALERGLIELVGPELGGRLRAGRSRNDQIATAIRSYLRSAARQITPAALDLIKALRSQAERHLAAIMPGRTHLQHAQPVLLSHQLLAHAWPLIRDLQRLGDLDSRLTVSPYGSGALAGNSLGLDPEVIAKDLGFASSVANSIDGTAARDLVAEAAFVFAQLGVHLSRLSEEVIIWVTHEFRFATLADAWATGSSIMPQKKNPDVAELARGKTGRLIGNLVSLLTMQKGLPLAYNRDLQEDKEPIFDSVDQLLLVLPAMAGMIRTLTFDEQRLQELAPQGFSLATDLADWLVQQRIPFARAHEIVGVVVRYCEVRSKRLEQLTQADLDELPPQLTSAALQSVSLAGAIARRGMRGGTAKSAVLDQLAELDAAAAAVGTRLADLQQSGP